MEQTTTETFRFDPAGRVGMGFRYCVEGMSPCIVIDGVDELLEKHQNLFMEDYGAYKRDVLLEVTADIKKTTEAYQPSIRLEDGDTSDKYVEHFETWHIYDIHDVKAVESL